MCGIAGILGVEPFVLPEAENMTKRMLDNISHRGPDDEGMEVIGPLERDSKPNFSAPHD